MWKQWIPETVEKIASQNGWQIVGAWSAPTYDGYDWATDQVREGECPPAGYWEVFVRDATGSGVYRIDKHISHDGVPTGWYAIVQRASGLEPEPRWYCKAGD